MANGCLRGINMDYEHHWYIDEAIYSLYASDSKAYYIKSHYDEGDDTWTIYHRRRPTPEITVMHPAFLYEHTCTPQTDYKWIKGNYKGLEDFIKDLANQHTVVPSIDTDDRIYVPKEGIIKAWRNWSDKQKQAYIWHITEDLGE